jgi:hypothetical protein
VAFAEKKPLQWEAGGDSGMLCSFPRRMNMNRPVLDPNTQAFLNAIGGQFELLDNSASAIAEARCGLTAAKIDDSQWPAVDVLDLLR